MALIYRKHKETGTIYVYESKPYWDREKKQTRSTRVCIGKLDEQGELILSARFTKPLPDILTGGNTETGKAPRRLYAGAVDLLDQAGQGFGFRTGLKECFPDCFRPLLSVIYFLILEGNAPLTKIERWSLTHEHPARETLSPDCVFSLLTALPEEGMRLFLSRLIPVLSLQPLRSGLNLEERAVCGMGFAVLCAVILLSAVLRRMSKNSFSAVGRRSRCLTAWM